MRYSHLNPREYARYVQLGTNTDAGFTANKNAPETDPFNTGAELSDIAGKLMKPPKRSDAPNNEDASSSTAASATFMVQNDDRVTAKGRDTWDLVGQTVNVLNATWRPGQPGRSPCRVAAFIGTYVHDGVAAASYVITDAEGDHYAIAAATLKSSLNKITSRKLRGQPTEARNTSPPSRKSRCS